MRVLVTGATGFIGSAVVAALRARGHAPVPAVHDDPGRCCKRSPSISCAIPLSERGSNNSHGMPLPVGWRPSSNALQDMAMACRLPVVWQMRLCDPDRGARDARTPLPPEYRRAFRAWIALGVPVLRLRRDLPVDGGTTGALDCVPFLVGVGALGR